MGSAAGDGEISSEWDAVEGANQRGGVRVKGVALHPRCSEAVKHGDEDENDSPKGQACLSSPTFDPRHPSLFLSLILVAPPLLV